MQDTLKLGQNQDKNDPGQFIIKLIMGFNGTITTTFYNLEEKPEKVLEYDHYEATISPDKTLTLTIRNGDVSKSAKRQLTTEEYNRAYNSLCQFISEDKKAGTVSCWGTHAELFFKRAYGSGNNYRLWIGYDQDNNKRSNFENIRTFRDPVEALHFFIDKSTLEGCLRELSKELATPFGLQASKKKIESLNISSDERKSSNKTIFFILSLVAAFIVGMLVMLITSK
ncbi:MAG: hypothetical protein NC098_02705 [Lachnoclostridium sp.]|nr:hypothetical protein [Lachnoclostridium sp.]